VELDEYIVMPNHFHGIIRVVETPLVGAPVARTTQNEGHP
jgi:hypothetical protein